MSLPACTCGSILRSTFRIPARLADQRALLSSSALALQQVSQSRRSSTKPFQTGPGVINEEEPAASARRSAENASRRQGVGPFPFVDQPGIGETPRRPWSVLSRGEKVGRSIANSSNGIFVIVFGLGLTGLVIYAVSSEIYAPNSPTNLYEEAAELVKRSPEVNAILLQPIKTHAESTGSRRARRVQGNVSIDKRTGRERMTIRFAVEGRAPESPEPETWVEFAKRWLRPIIIEPSVPTDLLPVPALPAKQPDPEPTSSFTGWLSSAFGSLMPSAFASKGGSDVSHASKLPTRPAKGSFSGAEALAIFLMGANGEFQLESLTVAYPDLRTWQWKTDVLAQQPGLIDARTEAPPRYRFWSRKV